MRDGSGGGVLGIRTKRGLQTLAMWDMTWKGGREAGSLEKKGQGTGRLEH